MVALTLTSPCPIHSRHAGWGAHEDLPSPHAPLLTVIPTEDESPAAGGIGASLVLASPKDVSLAIDMTGLAGAWRSS